MQATLALAITQMARYSSWAVGFAPLGMVILTARTVR